MARIRAGSKLYQVGLYIGTAQDIADHFHVPIESVYGNWVRKNIPIRGFKCKVVGEVVTKYMAKNVGTGETFIGTKKEVAEFLKCSAKNVEHAYLKKRLCCKQWKITKVNERKGICKDKEITKSTKFNNICWNINKE